MLQTLEIYFWVKFLSETACMLVLICAYLHFWKRYGDFVQGQRRRSFPVVEFPLSPCHFCYSVIRERNISYVWWFFLLHRASYLKRRQLINWSFTLTTMGTKIKGIYKGFKYGLSQIFVVKEREIEIGYPTDVKHVAHIGWDGHSASAPSWMNEFRTVPDFTTTSIGNSGSALSPWSSQDYGEPTSQQQQQSGSEMLKEIASAELPGIKKKQKRKKSKSTSSPKSNSSHSSRTSRATKSKSKLVTEGSTKPAKLEVL